MQILVDTNILLRAIQRHHPSNHTALTALRKLHRDSCTLCLTLQNLSEFWNVCTRPQKFNGLGFPVETAARHVNRLERFFTILPDTMEVIQHWRHLVVTYDVKGVQVHDARLVAAMKAHNITQIITFNVEDFTRFSDIEIIHPQSLV